MKVCFISPAAYPLLVEQEGIKSAGGAEVQLKTIGLSLFHKGVEVSFVVDEYNQADFLEFNGISVFKAPLRYLGGNNRYIFQDWWNLCKCLRRIDADIYLLKIPKDLLVPVGIYCWLHSKKLVYIGQSDKDVNFTLLRTMQNKVAVFLYRFGLKFVDHVVAQTQVQYTGFCELGLKTTIIKNILTLSPIKTEKKNYILWVGNDTVNKQSEMFAEIARKLPGYHFKMILASSSSTVELKFIEFASANNNFEYLGFIPISSIAQYFSEAALLVCTSLREGFPNTFLQAWQFGTPVISLQVDPDNVIRQHDLGRVSGSFTQLCSDIEFLLSNDYVREMISENCKNYVRNNHAPDKIINQYYELIIKIVND